MPADSSALASRWISEVRACTVFILYRVRSRTSFSSAGGIYDPRSSPHSNSSASRAQSLASVLWPSQRLGVRRVDHRDLPRSPARTARNTPARCRPRWPPSPRASRPAGAARGPSAGAPRKTSGTPGSRVLRVHGFSPGDRIATLTMSLCTSIPATRSYSTFMRWPPPAAAPPLADGNRRAARQDPGSVQETDTRARSSNGGYPAQGPSANLTSGLQRSKANRRRQAARQHNCAPSTSPPPAPPPPQDPSRQRPAPARGARGPSYRNPTAAPAQRRMISNLMT